MTNAKAQLEGEVVKAKSTLFADNEDKLTNDNELPAKALQVEGDLPSPDSAKIQLETEVKSEITGDVQVDNNDVKVSSTNDDSC